MNEYAALTTITATGNTVVTTIREAGPSPFLIEVKVNGIEHRTKTHDDIERAILRQDYMHDAAVSEFGGYPAAQPTAAPVVDMGGDFDGFVEAVNAPTQPTDESTQPNLTDPAAIAEYVNVDKDVNAGVVVSPTDGRYYASVSVNGSVVDNELFDDKYLAMQWAKTWFECHTEPVTVPQTVQPETSFDYMQMGRALAETMKSGRIARLRQRIASQERELADLRFELAQLVGE